MATHVRHQTALDRFSRWYLALSVLVFNTCVLFLAVNLTMAGWFWIKTHTASARAAATSEIAEHNRELNRLLPYYAGWTIDQIKALQAEDSRIRMVFEPFTQVKPQPVRGAYINISEQGFRLVKNQGPWPPDPAALTVFVFGGSTTFGSSLGDEQTIVSSLQDQLGSCRAAAPIFVYNFGRPMYFSSQERALFELLVSQGHVPDIAIFIDGVNDFYRWSGVPYWTRRISDLVERENGRQTLMQRSLDRLAELPLGRAATQWRTQIAHLSEPAEPGYDDPVSLKQIVDRWQVNRRMIESVAEAFGVQPLFVWQPVPTYHYDLTYHLLYPHSKEVDDAHFFREHLRTRYGYALLDRLRQTGELGAHVLWLGDLQQGRKENFYVDRIHYTPAFSREIAERIFDALGQQGTLTCGRYAAPSKDLSQASSQIANRP